MRLGSGLNMANFVFGGGIMVVGEERHGMVVILIGMQWNSEAKAEKIFESRAEALWKAWCASAL